MPDESVRSINVLTSAAYGGNPFVRLMNGGLQRTGRVNLSVYTKRRAASRWPDIWHLNWPEHAFAHRSSLVSSLKAVKLLAQLSLARRRGTGIVLTVHNLVPHRSQNARVDRWFWPALDRRVDLFVHLSQAGLGAFREAGRGSSHAGHLTLFHPRYEFAAQALPTRAQARRSLGLGGSDLVLVTIGRLAANKGIAEATRCIRTIPNQRLRYLVAGIPETERTKRTIEMAAHGDERIRLEPRYLSDTELLERSIAADLIVLPYRSFLNSGALLHALSLERPVLVARTDVTAEIQASCGSGWVRTYQGELTPEAISHAVEGLPPEGTAPSLEHLSWETFATQLVAGYDDIVARRRLTRRRRPDSSVQ